VRTWFTADTHFGHAKTIKYCGRPFKNIERMNEVLINNWNKRVSKNDTVIFLGDFCFRQKNKVNWYIDHLNGNIVFIKGNHDHNNSLNTRIESLVVHFPKQDVFCTHRPEDYSNSYFLNLIAHIHDKWKIRKIYNSYLLNVGVDQWKFHPINIQEILKALKEYILEEKKRK